MDYKPKLSKNKENLPKHESFISASYRHDTDSLTSRLPAKVLPTFIFSLHPSKTPEKILQKTPSKKTLTRNASTRKSLKSLKTSKKSLQNKSVLSENPQKTFKIPKNLSRINLKNLIKAINEHCCLCPKFIEELKKKDLF